MALKPTPDAVVVAVPGSTTELVPLNVFREAPARPGLDTDHLLVLDLLGQPVRIPFVTLPTGPAAPEIPDNALVTESGDYIVDELGAYITA